ncbi:hypothetical protein [Herbiconiux sp. A18JL235]|uniref:Uncharacterized protein n=1 Tax=Herbiconiux sp. A18JL235 TaxID=3152363 RepID=A0AB39BKY5_9MICO
MSILKPRRTKHEGLSVDSLPVLGAGKHRSARSGACFMEYASFLAGERWSDHPSCTHAGLAHLARAVNDLTSNEARGRLAPLVPGVIGLTSDDIRLDLLLAVHTVALSLPEAPVDRQHALAVGALVCRAALLRLPDAEAPDHVEATAAALAEVEEALAAAPDAHRWAARFLDRNLRWQRGEITRRQTQATIAMAVDGVRSACADFPDDRLYALLASSIALVERFVAAETGATKAMPAVAAEKVRSQLVS